MSLSAAPASAEAVLAAFETAAGKASEAEAAMRRHMEAEILRLERERAFAYRRLNFMRALSSGIHPAENEQAAVANGCAVVRAELYWENDSETRTETLAKLAPVIQATFGCLTAAAGDRSAEDIVQALSDFEAWYRARFGQPFWMLFERHIEELPLVER